MMDTSKALLVVLAALGVAGCRPEPDPSEPVYRNADDFINPNGPPQEVRVGADPYEDGERRLALGFSFYEGGFSEQVIIDDVTTHFYIYDGTFSFGDETQVVEEGLTAGRITHAGLTFLGGGITWDDPRDLTEWTTLYVSLNSSDPAFAEVRIQISGNDSGVVNASTYGYVNDGEWHHIAIPLSDITGPDYTQITEPLQFFSDAGDQGETLYVDNVYYTQD